jgi:hypothetical protein
MCCGDDEAKRQSLLRFAAVIAANEAELLDPVTTRAIGHEVLREQHRQRDGDRQRHQLGSDRAVQKCRFGSARRVELCPTPFEPDQRADGKKCQRRKGVAKGSVRVG